MQRAELVREEVIEAALAEFAERGYHQTSISHIAKRLGSGHSMFYRYFENKRDIVDHAVRQVNARVLAAIGDSTPGRLTSITEFRDHLLGIGMAYSELLADEPRLMQLIVVQAAGVDQQMTEEFQRLFDDGARVLATMLRDGIKQGYIRADVDVRATAQTICAIPFGIALRYGQKPSREELLAQTIASNELVCRGIATEWPQSGQGSGSPMTDQAQPRGLAKWGAIAEAIDWVKRYLQNHPIASLSTAGGQIVLGLRTLEYLFFDIVKGRFQVREFLDQAAFMAGTAFTPTVLVTIPISVTLSIQFALLAGQVGASSLSGAATGLVVIRQGAPLVASLLLATAVGSAVCADLGSRTMREEISAMEVMGVSPIQRLVVPRLVALVLIGVLLTGVTSFVGYLASYMFNVYLQNGTPGSFIATFSSFSTVGDLALAMVKAIVFGVIVAVISCHKGLDTRGGPAGVANSVNAAVVESVLLMMIVNVVMSQLYVVVFPKTSI